ncbi:MAG: hypothetical protein AB2L13_21000 [Spirochaetota bacterium]
MSLIVNEKTLSAEMITKLMEYPIVFGIPLKHIIAGFLVANIAAKFATGRKK